MPSLALPDRDASIAAAPSSPFATVTAHADAAAVVRDWAELEACAPCSIYQTRGFILPWIATLGARAGVLPRFIMARDEDDRPVALLLLGITRSRGVTVAGWLGGRDANLPMALLRRSQDWSAADLLRLLRSAARALGAPDVFALPNQPTVFAGAPNPFIALPHGPSPSAAYGTALPSDAEQLFAAKLSKDARKKLRKKEAKLAGMGEVRHVVATTAIERTRVIDAVIAHKSLRLRARGIASDFEAPEMRGFIEQTTAAGTIELHALTLDDRIIAVYGGGVHGGHWSGMFNAFDPDEAIARVSPGDLLLMRLIAHCCARGIGRFDLGIGEARYKAALCDEAIALFDVVVPMSPIGRGYALMLRMRRATKRRIKRDPRLHALALRLRRTMS